MTYERSIAAFARARGVIAGGVNSSVRAFKAVGGSPVFISSAAGATVCDLDGHEYLDYVLSWGPLLFGHAHPAVVHAIAAAAARGSSFGAPTEAETELAELICAMVPSVERVRFTSSGTEAAMSAVRLARGYAHREKILKFAGCYHGAADPFLISAGSSALALGIPSSPGVPHATASETLVAQYNDAAAVRSAFEAHRGEIAAVIVEPYAGNMGLVLPEPGFLASLREICTREHALLIFDEVMTGFRVARGGAQEREGVLPDLTVLGKVIGGGLPVGAFGGRAEIMAYVSPDGPVFHAGTLSGNPLAMAAGVATLKMIRDDATLFSRLEVLTGLLTAGLGEIFHKYGLPYQSSNAGSMFGTFLRDERVLDLRGAMQSDAELYAKYFHAMLDGGVYLAPSQYESGFVCTVHTMRDIERTLTIADRACAGVATARR
ncbi:MAG: glutamate-1-semialdehyde 2,1-aminomutase [Candidatus Tyrphobacter sp.]